MNLLIRKLAIVWLVGTTCCHAAASADESVPVWKFSAAQLQPFWHSETMLGESVLFVRRNADDPPQASLLFPATQILSVTDSTGAVTYEAGRDYIWIRGEAKIHLPPDSRIVSKTPEDLRRPAGSQRHRLTHRDGNGEILFGAGHEYHDMQTIVSYTHEPNLWTGPVPKFAGAQLPHTIKKLSTGQPLTIALLGDSISTGCNASAWVETAPFQPAYQDLLVLNLQATYGSDVAMKNFAVGGTDTDWGLRTIDKVIQAQPDLVILAFGMNDAGSRSPADYQANVRAMIAQVRGELPYAEFILVASMLGNRDWTYLQHERFPQYRDVLSELCSDGIVLADMTSIWAELLKRKKDWDLTGNGVNHPNDFGHRIYAQTLSSLLFDSP